MHTHAVAVARSPARGNPLRDKQSERGIVESGLVASQAQENLGTAAPNFRKSRFDRWSCADEITIGFRTGGMLVCTRRLRQCERKCDGYLKCCVLPFR
jgi:hypothetical protein